MLLEVIWYNEIKSSVKLVKPTIGRQIHMKEWIGTCKKCGENIHCENGFFNGVVLPNHEYLCFDCEEMESRKGDGDNK